MLMRWLNMRMRVGEREAPLGLGAFGKRGIGHAPMGGHGLARPDGANLIGGVVADGEHEIERRVPGRANSSHDLERKPLMS